MSVRITRIAFVYHRVTDIVRARDFYERVLGLRVALEYEGAPGKWWIEYDVDEVAFAITNVGVPNGNGGAVPAFEVADVQYRELAECETESGNAFNCGPCSRARVTHCIQEVGRVAARMPFGRLWYAEPNAISHAIGHAKHRSRSHDAVIRVCDAAGNVIETHEHAGRTRSPR